MAKLKATTKTAKDLGLTPHEERLLQAYFRRQTRPYLVGLLIVGAVLGVLFTVGFPAGPERAQDEPKSAAEIAQLRSELQASVAGELSGLREQLAALEGSFGAFNENGGLDASADAIEEVQKVDDKLKRLSRRLDGIEKKDKATREQVAALADQLERGLVDAAVAKRLSPQLAPSARQALGSEESGSSPATDSDMAFE